MCFLFTVERKRRTYDVKWGRTVGDEGLKTTEQQEMIYFSVLNTEVLSDWDGEGSELVGSGVS